MQLIADSLRVYIKFDRHCNSYHESFIVTALTEITAFFLSGVFLNYRIVYKRVMSGKPPFHPNAFAQRAMYSRNIFVIPIAR